MINKKNNMFFTRRITHGVLVGLVSLMLTLASGLVQAEEAATVDWTTFTTFSSAVAVDSSGNAYVTGFTTDLSNNDITLTKYNSLGVEQWSRQWGSEYHDYSSDVMLDSTGNVYVTGETTGNLDGNTNADCINYTNRCSGDIFLTKFDSNGVKLWTQQWGTVGSDTGSSIVIDINSNIYITGTTFISNYGALYVAKLNDSGTIQWARELIAPTPWAFSVTYGNDISIDSNGNVYVTGLTDGNIDGGTQVVDYWAGNRYLFVVKYDNLGDRQWTLQTNKGVGTGVVVDSNDNIVIAGYVPGAAYNQNGWNNVLLSNIFLTKYDSNGVELWRDQQSTFELSEVTHALAIDSNDNLYLTGEVHDYSTPSPGNYTADMFVTKYDSAGTEVMWHQLDWGSYEYGKDIVVDDSGKPYIIGSTFGGNFLAKLSTTTVPIADAGLDQTVTVFGQNADVILNGSGSSDTDGDTLSYSWTGSFGTATGVSPTVPLGIGVHTITLEVNDGEGGISTDIVVVTVELPGPPGPPGGGGQP